MKKEIIYIPCECAGKEKTCGYLVMKKISGVETDIEIYWLKNKKQKKAKVGIFIYKEKTIKKIIEFLKGRQK